MREREGRGEGGDEREGEGRRERGDSKKGDKIDNASCTDNIHTDATLMHICLMHTPQLSALSVISSLAETVGGPPEGCAALPPVCVF